MANPIIWLQESGISKARFRPGILLLELGFFPLWVTCPVIKITAGRWRNEGLQDKASEMHIHPPSPHTYVPRKVEVRSEHTPQ